MLSGSCCQREFDALADRVDALGADVDWISQVPGALRGEFRAAALARALRSANDYDGVIEFAVGATRPCRFLKCCYRQQTLYEDFGQFHEAAVLLDRDN
jgi:hypothetical protein